MPKWAGDDGRSHVDRDLCRGPFIAASEDVLYVVEVDHVSV